jgi:hypothetical protein
MQAGKVDVIAPGPFQARGSTGMPERSAASSHSCTSPD